MISQESTTKDAKPFGYDFRGHARGTLAVGIAYGYSLRFVQALRVCSVRPKVLTIWAKSLVVQFGQESCPAGEYLKAS